MSLQEEYAKTHRLREQVRPLLLSIVRFKRERSHDLSTDEKYLVRRWILILQGLESLPEYVGHYVLCPWAWVDDHLDGIIDCMCQEPYNIEKEFYKLCEFKNSTSKVKQYRPPKQRFFDKFRDYFQL